MEDDTVREGVETILVKAATTIMAGNGFSYVVPSRAASNQLYVRALDRIVLKVGCLCGCESGIVVVAVVAVVGVVVFAATSVC